MAIIKSKYILYTTLTTLALFSAFQHLEACCGDTEDDTEEKRPLRPTARTSHETALPSANTIISLQPQRIEGVLNPELKTADESKLLTRPPLQDSLENSDLNPSNSLLPSEEPSLVDYVSGNTSLNTSSSSAVGSASHRLGLAEFEKQSEPILSYIMRHSSTNSAFQISFNEKQWILTATPKDGVKKQLILTYLTREDSTSPLLEKLLSLKLEARKSVKDVIIEPSLKLYIEENDQDLYRKLAGILLYAHKKAKGNIYCQKASSIETIFEIKDDPKVPYPYLYVIAGPTTSSNLRAKRDAFQK